MRKFIDFSTEPVMRTLRLPAGTWSAAKATAQSRGVSARQFLNDGITKQLPSLVKQLTAMGIVEGKQTFKLIRLPLTADALAMLRTASNETGLPAVRLLALCLKKQVGRRRLCSAAGTAARPPSRKSKRPR